MREARKNFLTGICFGTFDNLHPGHLDFFRQAKEKCDYLYVVVARAENVKKIKGNYPQQGEGRRLNKVSQTPGIDKAFLGDIKDKYRLIREISPRVIFLGYDQEINLEELKKIHSGEIIRLNSYIPEVYKSSKINVCRYCSDNRRA